MSVHDLSRAQIQQALVADGLARAHAAPLWRALYQGDPGPGAGLFSDQARAQFPPPLRRWVDARGAGSPGFFQAPLGLARETIGADGLTRKCLWRLADGREIETVLMAYPGRATACVSTQAGCAMGCVFCATGQGGFFRHLGAGEIVAQVLQVQRGLRRRGQAGLRNLVLMGMGEPLHNYDAVLAALGIITDTGGLNIGPRRITISTVGVVPGIRRLAAEPQPFNLAVSLHAATQEERARLVPVASRWPLDELMAACRDYCAATGRRIFFEWTLIAGQNDSAIQADQIVKLLCGLSAHVNLIPLNSTLGYPGRATGVGEAAAFRARLQAAGIPTTIRQRRGIDVAAGCGQLAGGTIS